MGKSAHATSGPGEVGPLLVVLSGPSGVGKDSVLSRLEQRGVPAHITVTATTRPRRGSSQRDDERYAFLAEEAFEQLLAEDGLLEHATVYGYHYGVPKAPLREALARGKDVLMRVDVQGAATIKKLVPQAVLIFIAPPSMKELAGRLRDRGQDDAAALERRLEAATRELDRRSEFDYVVTNEKDGLDHAADQVLAIMAAERSRAGRQPVVL